VVTREREDTEDVEVAAVVDEADVEENIEDEEVIVEATPVVVKTEVSEGAEGVKTEVTEGTEEGEVVVTETEAETEGVTVEIKMADSRTENSDPVAIGVDPEGEGKVVEDAEVNLIATTNDPNKVPNNNQTATEKMATTKKITSNRRQENRKNAETTKK